MNKTDLNLQKVTAGDMPEIVRIELTNTCNMACPHCRHHSPDKRLPENYPEYYKTAYHMSEKQVNDIYTELGEHDKGNYKPSITLNVANEPLVAKNFKFAVIQTKKYHLAGTFNTNGLLLNEDMCNFLANQNFDSVNISIDAITSESLKKVRGITALDKLQRNVKRLIDARGPKKLPRVGVTFVVMPTNSNEIQGFIDYWKDYVDLIRFTGYITDGRPDISVLPGVEANQKFPSRVPCKQIFKDIVIRANGEVTPCVITAEDPEYYSMGNIFLEGGIKNVWNGKKFNEWRTKHNAGKWDEISYCKGCDYWVDSFDVREKEDKEFLIRSPSPYTVFYNVKKRMFNWDREQLVDRQGFIKEKVGKVEKIVSFD